MANIWERYKSRRWTKSASPTAELTYFVSGTADEVEVTALAEATAPTEYQGIRRRETIVEAIHDDTVTPAACLWEVTLRYNNKRTSSTNRNTPDEFTKPAVRYRIDTTGGTEHITQGVKGQSARTAGATDYKDLIGVDGMSVQGTQRVAPSFKHTETHWIEASQLDGSYLKTLSAMTGKVNSNEFRGFDPGEVLFMGVTADWTAGDAGADMTFNFSIVRSGTAEAVDFENNPLSLDVAGHDYVWTEAKEKDIGTTNPLKAIALVGLHKNKIYEDADFSDLEIG